MQPIFTYLNQYLTVTYQYLTDTYWYLHDYSLFNWYFTNAKLVLIDSLNQIKIYQYLTVTYQYLVCAYIVQATLNHSWPIFKQQLQTCDSKTDLAWIGNSIEIKLKNNLWV